MTTTTLPDDPLVWAALRLARLWCDGHRIGGKAALDHAQDVAAVLLRHIPRAEPVVIAAVLLHDSPELAPSHIDLDVVLATVVSPEVARLVRALHHEHEQLATDTPPTPPADDVALMQASAADKIISTTTVLDHARTEDPAAYWSARSGFVTALPYLRDFCAAADAVLPPTMATELGDLIDRAGRAISGTKAPD
jgi:hypothetical protein